MRRILPLAVPLSLLLAACAGAEKLGDRAAAVGDWKTAERQYAEALQKDPGNAEKRAKYQQARQQALQGALAAARACQVSQDWECAYGESDYAFRLEPGSAEISAMRAGAARNVGLQRLRGAQDASGRRDHRSAFDLFNLHADRTGAFEIGAVTFRLMDALAGELELADRSIVELRVVGEPSPLEDGQSQGFSPVEPLPAPPRTPSAAPAPGARNPMQRFGR